MFLPTDISNFNISNFKHFHFEQFQFACCQSSEALLLVHHPAGKASSLRYNIYGRRTMTRHAEIVLNLLFARFSRIQPSIALTSLHTCMSMAGNGPKLPTYILYLMPATLEPRLSTVHCTGSQEILHYNQWS